MKLEIKLIFAIVAILIIANPMVMNAKGFNKGDAGYKDPMKLIPFCQSGLLWW